MDPLLIVKLVVLAYILVSPFISHTWLLPLNSTPVKILFLVVIVAVSFVDLQLAILLMIAFLVIVVNLNKDELVRLQKPVTQENKIIQEMLPTVTKEHMVRGQTIYPQPSDVSQPAVDAQRQNLMIPETFTQSQEKPQVAQTMYDFPKPYCKGVGDIDPYQISNNLFLYSTDERTKPYEEYVKLLSPDLSLQTIQDNHV